MSAWTAVGLIFFPLLFYLITALVEAFLVVLKLTCVQGPSFVTKPGAFLHLNFGHLLIQRLFRLCNQTHCPL